MIAYERKQSESTKNETTDLAETKQIEDILNDSF